MDRDLDAVLGFAPDYDAPIPYMQRTRDYYRAIGYTTPYRWAHHVEAPFTPLTKPLARSRVTIVTTAAPFRPDKGDQGPGAAYNGGAKFYQVYSGDTAQAHDLRISHIGYDRVHTTAEDSGTWFPLPALQLLAEQGRIGAVTQHFHGAPTNRSHRVTIETDAPEILRRCREDGADAAVLVPNCPVCHQTCSLVARHLEANGIPTVVMGAAKDIVEHAAVPRFLFSDFPLGNSAGKPHDRASQAQTLELALRVLEAAPGPRTTMQSPLRWSEDASWKLDYLNIERMPPEELARRRREFDEEKAKARRIREGVAA
jgi:glycine/betaine/sarcosine/D-proline reductase family selenoprotein B